MKKRVIILSLSFVIMLFCSACGVVHRYQHTPREYRNKVNSIWCEDGTHYIELPGSTVVSMNFWGFTGGFLDHAKRMFPQFLARTMAGDAMKGEFYLPAAVGQLLEENAARIKVLKSADQWFGVTYREDKPSVVNAIARLTEEGLYPDDLWGGK